jgi:putative mRNA 3-end processing factor
MRYTRRKDVYRMFATGWQKARMACDSVLQISDHADWKELLSMIERVRPRQVFTLHGDGTNLRNHLSGTGIDVQLLDQR